MVEILLMDFPLNRKNQTNHEWIEGIYEKVHKYIYIFNGNMMGWPLKKKSWMIEILQTSVGFYKKKRSDEFLTKAEGYKYMQTYLQNLFCMYKLGAKKLMQHGFT